MNLQEQDQTVCLYVEGTLVATYPSEAAARQLGPALAWKLGCEATGQPVELVTASGRSLGHFVCKIRPATAVLEPLGVDRLSGGAKRESV